MSALLQSLLRQVEEGDGPDVALDRELVAAFPSRGHKGNGPVCYATHTIDAAIHMAQRIEPDIDELHIYGEHDVWFAFIEQTDGNLLYTYTGFSGEGVDITNAPRAIVAAALRARLKP